MKQLVQYITESDVTKLKDVDKVFVEYLVKGIQSEKNKMKAIENLTLMLPTKQAFSSKLTCRDIVITWLSEYASEVPEPIGDEEPEQLYNYLMAVTDKDIENSYK